MSKVIKVIDTILPWLVILTFACDAFIYYNIDSTRFTIDIAAIGGWVSLIDIRDKYHSLKKQIEEKSSNES